MGHLLLTKSKLSHSKKRTNLCRIFPKKNKKTNPLTNVHNYFDNDQEIFLSSYCVQIFTNFSYDQEYFFIHSGSLLLDYLWIQSYYKKLVVCLYLCMSVNLSISKSSVCYK